LYNVIPTKVGAVQDLAQLTSNFGAEPIENWHGVDVGVNARLRNGLTVQGGTSTGRTLQDNCALRSVLPETYPWSSPVLGVATIATTQSGRGNTTTGLTSPYCRSVEPFLTSFRGLATYVVPKVDIQVSGTWRSDPGNDLAANYVVTNAIANSGPRPLGRNLSSGNVTVNLIPPNTLYADRRNNIDFRLAKIFHFGRTRTQVGFDVYNVLNSDTVLTFNQNYVPNGAWLTPSTIAVARYVKINAQIDF
jgi:hypothetical protein